MAPPKAKSRQCIKCNILGKIHGHGMCKKCWSHEYDTHRVRPKRQCIGCKTLSEIKGHDMCIKCWSYEYRRRPTTMARPPRRCINCHILGKIHGFGMCRKCYNYEYTQRPEEKEKRRLYAQRRFQLLEVKEWKRRYKRRPEQREKARLRAQEPENKEKRRLYMRRPEVVQRRRIREELRRVNAQTSECPGCTLEKKMYRAGLCRYCYDNRMYGSMENVRKIKREQMLESRKTSEGKIKAKAYNALETTRTYKRVFARRSRFFSAGKAVGPFDPNEILKERLLQALQEVREGNLELPLRRPGL